MQPGTTADGQPKPAVHVGLIGMDIRRSLSPTLHETEAAHHGLHLRYELIDVASAAVTPQTLPQLLNEARRRGFRGLNITYPFKQAVLPLLDSLSAEAQAIGAVNTVLFDDGKATGHNTDALGWSRAFQAALPAADLRCVTLIGAGGAGSAVAHAALRSGVARLLIHDRDQKRAELLAHALCTTHGAGCASVVVHTDTSDTSNISDATTNTATNTTTNAALQTALKQSSGLIHASPTGMEKQPGLPLPPHCLHAGLWVSEVVYVPLETALLKAARAAGCRTVDGGGMAVWQAAGAFELFTGKVPNAARMNAHFRACMALRTNA